MRKQLHAFRARIARMNLPWPERRAGVAAPADAPQSGVLRAALAAGVGYGFLLSFPALLYGIAVHGGLVQRLIDARNPQDFGLLALWLGLAALAALVSVSLLRLRPVPPPGYDLSREAAPELFKLVDELRRAFPRGPLRRPVGIQRIRINQGAALAVVRTPRCGFPFARTNTLTIGLAALQTLTPEQFHAALARCIGQLAGRDHPLARWLYHLGGTWSCYGELQALRPAAIRWPVQRFFRWYRPWFRRLSAEAVRAYEYEGDAYGLEVVDHESISESLVAMAINQRFLSDRFWPAIDRMRGKLPEPSHRPYAHLEQAFRKGVTSQQRQAWLAQVLRRVEAEPAIPDLQARVAELGWDRDRLPAWSEPSAARHYLGASLDAVIQATDDAWWQENKRRWRKHFRKHQQAKPRLHALGAKLEASPLSEAELEELVKLIHAHARGASAVALYQAVLRKRADDARMHFAIGRRLLRFQQAAGVSALERAMELDEQYVQPVCRLISQTRGLPAQLAAEG